MGRLVKDATFIDTSAFPAAGATNYSTPFNLGANAGFIPEGIELQIVVPPTPANVDSTKSLVVQVQDSADGTNFTDVAAIGPVTIAGVATTGAATVTQNFRPPAGLRPYVRVRRTVPTGAGDNTAVSTTFQLLF